ncbi:MAG: SCO family protein [Opitutales bacterium]
MQDIIMFRTGNRFFRKRGSIFAGLFLMAFLMGCSGQGKDLDDGLPGYPLTGEILEIREEEGSLLVQHDEIEGYMPAMTMLFRVAPSDLANAEVGARIRARLIQEEGGSFRLERIWPADETTERTLTHLNRRLREDTVIRGAAAYRDVGEEMPRFALFDQSGALVRPERFSGKSVVVNFIFTRCPDPHMCPAATQRMIQLQQVAREEGIKDFELLSITLDPEYDTPGVLRQYAENLHIDLENYSFLTGPEGAVRDLMTQLGILTREDDGPLIQHTMATILVDADGRILHRVDGSEWMVGDFLNRLKASQ